MTMVEARKNEDGKDVADSAAPLVRFADASAKMFAEQAAAMAIFTAYGMSMASQMTGMMLGAMNAPSTDESVIERVVPDAAKTPSDNVVLLVRKTKSKVGVTKAAPAMPVEGDDLKKIPGIGPRMEKVLHERGILRFADLAALSKAALKKLDSELGLEGRVIKDDWGGQARALSEGKG